MPEAFERDQPLAAPAHLATSAMPFSVEPRGEVGEDQHYREIAHRRAQLENAEILRRARAL